METKTKSLKKGGSPAKAAEETTKKAVTQKVIVNRELKYVYPKGMTDTLKRKAFRQKARNFIRRMERELATPEKVKDVKTIQKKLQEYKEAVLA